MNVDTIVDAPATDRPAAAALLEVTDLTVRFRLGGRVVRAVSGVSYALEEGQTVAIVGESGSGKTVSARAIMGLLPPTAEVGGSVRFRGEELVGLSERGWRRHRGPDLAMVFQDPARSLNPTMRVGAQVTEAVRTHADLSRSAARERALELLALVRLPSVRERYDQYPHELSGGMRQRVMIAIALASDPNVLIADEATTALDVTTQAQIMGLLKDLQQELRMALVMITHDMALAARYSDEILVMYAGKVVEYAPTSAFFVGGGRMPYTRALLEAVPDMSRPAHSLFPVVPGRPPDLTSLPTGCSFSPRCPCAQDDCREVIPELVEHEAQHGWACLHPLAPTGGPGV
ncbi:MAG TPA: ABC transporter ATP-binding protein [Solirubrobacteraceae bacterium]|nr:ABC transporter ATP-binding protein [Solirubrobacteraceae bacterium]